QRRARLVAGRVPPRALRPGARPAGAEEPRGLAPHRRGLPRTAARGLPERARGRGPERRAVRGRARAAARARLRSIEMEPGTTVYTVGHSTRAIGELVALLREAGVRLLLDVRRFPVSRRYPH